MKSTAVIYVCMLKDRGELRYIPVETIMNNVYAASSVAMNHTETKL